MQGIRLEHQERAWGPLLTLLLSGGVAAPRWP